ncbi:hypothetical protein ElyMa_006154100 [Elysia marginata]|uniref:Uncharacterized protein n=1 Tax=Elysia marginata TaxID=1093978 RepID=A0AAV4GYY8_9GAST|nr:hypothetical protein ElyMa_006154100 [Elysia marginata]
MSWMFCEEEESGERQIFKTWKRNFPAKAPSEREISAKINMSNINSVSSLSKAMEKKTPDSGSCEEAAPLTLNQETTFTEDFSAYVNRPVNGEAYGRAKGLGEHPDILTKNRTRPHRVLDSKGGEQQHQFFTSANSSDSKNMPCRMRSTSLSSDAASSTSASSNYVSDNGSIVDLTEPEGKARSRSSSSSTAMSTTSSASVQPAWVQPDELSAANQNTDSAIDVEEEYVIDDIDFPNEARPLLFNQNDHITESSRQSSKLFLPPLQETVISDTATATNTIPCPQTNQVHTVSSYNGKENQNPVMEPVVAKSFSDERAPLSEKATKNETVYNLQSVLSYNAPSFHKEKEVSRPPVLEVLVPALQNTINQDKPIKSGKKNTNTRKKRGLTPFPLSYSSHSYNINTSSPSAYSSEAAAAAATTTTTEATIHHYPCSKPTRDSRSGAQPLNDTSFTQPFSSSQNSNSFNFESHVQPSHLQPQYNQSNIPQGQASLETQSRHVYTGSSQGLPSNSVAHTLNGIQLSSYGTGTNPDSEMPNNVSSNLPQGTQYVATNQPNPQNLSKAHSFVPNIPYLSVIIPPRPHCHGYEEHNLFQTNPNMNNMSQNNPTPEQASFQAGTQAQQQTHQPFVAVMHPHNFQNCYHYGYAPPLGLPMYYGPFPVADQSSFRPNLQNYGFYSLHRSPPILPHVLSGPVPQQQHLTPTLVTAFTPVASTSSPQTHAPINHSERHICPRHSEVDSNDKDTLIPNNRESAELFSFTNELQCHTAPVKNTKGQVARQTLNMDGMQYKNDNPRASNSEAVAMHNHHNTMMSRTASNLPETFTVVEMSSRKNQEDMSRGGTSNDCPEEMHEQSSGSGQSSNISENLSDNRHSLARQGDDSIVFTDINGQDGPVPTVVADRRESLPSSIRSVAKENNSESQLLILKDKINILRNAPSRCYRNLCIVSSIVNPVFGLVALLLLFLAARDYKGKRYTRSSHLQLAAIILSTLGIFITLNIMFLLAVPWAVNLSSSLEVIRIGGSGNQINMTEVCLKRQFHDDFLQDYNLDKESYCAVVWRPNLKAALNAHLVRDRAKEREWKRKFDELVGNISQAGEMDTSSSVSDGKRNIDEYLSKFLFDLYGDGNSTDNFLEGTTNSNKITIISSLGDVSNSTHEESQSGDYPITTNFSGPSDTATLPVSSRSRPDLFEDAKDEDDNV